jgi:methyltransferase (TIGR00027 family)
VVAGAIAALSSPAMTEPLIRHVSDTAFLVAHHRAVESARADALFEDPLAARLAGERGRTIASGLVGSAMTGWTIAVRTRLIDEYIQQAVGRGIDTIVNLGAGLDTRPYRLELPASLTWIEVDYPDVVAFKEDRLADVVPRCRLERIGLDLALVPARRELLARLDARAGRAQILTEGVVPYLDVAEAAALADDLRAMSHVESWIVDYVSPESMAYRRRTGIDRQMAQAPFEFTPPDWFGFFAEHGWRSREVRYLAVEGKRWGRRAPLPWTIRTLMTLLRPFMPAARKGRLARFAGYVVLEPAAPSSVSELSSRLQG